MRSHPREVAHDRAEVHETLEATRKVLSEQRDVEKDGLVGRMRELVAQVLPRLSLCLCCVCVCAVSVYVTVSVAVSVSVSVLCLFCACFRAALTVWAGAAP